MAAKSVEFQILARTDRAVNSIDKFAKNAQKSAKRVEKSFSALKTVAIGAVGFLAGRAVINGIKTVTEAASIQEDAINNLNTALKISGEFSEAASRDMQAFASAIQDTTKFGDEAILQQLALAKAFGASNKQAKLITEAAVELSAATGKSLDGATRQVSKTLGGFAGELGEVNPAIKALTAEQLKAGEAAEILIEQYGGSAQAQINTFSGALTQMTNLQGDLNEEIGFLITQNPLVVGAIKQMSEGFKILIDTVNNNQDKLQEFINDGLLAVAKAIPPLIKGFGIVAQTFRGVSLTLGLIVSQGSRAIRALLEFDAVSKVTRVLIKGLQIVINRYETLTRAASLAAKVLKLDGVSGALESAADGIKGMSLELEEFSDQEDIFKGAKERLEEIQIESTKTTQSFNNFFAGIESAADTVANVFDGIIGKITETKLAANDAANIETGDGADPDEDKKDEKGGIGGAIVSGFSTGIDIFADFMQGGFIDRTISAFESITALPEKFGEFASRLSDVGLSLVDGLGSAIDGIVDQIPKINRKIIEIFNKIVDLFVKKGPDIFQALIDAAIEAAEALVKALPKLIAVIPVLVDKLAKAIPKLLRVILQGLPAIITAIANALPKIFRSIAAAIPEIVVVFAENIAPIILALTQGFVEAIPAIIFALVDELILKGGIIRIVFALVKAIPQVAIAFVQGVTRGLGSSLPKVFGGLSKIFSSGIKLPKFGIPQRTIDILNGKFFVDKLREFFTGKNAPHNKIKGIFDGIINKFRDLLGNIKIGGGGGGGGGVFNFATGGQVPAGFPNDTFPARLTSGELVIPPGDVPRLSRFLDRAEVGGGGNAAIDYEKLAALLEGRPINVTLEINEQVLSRATLRARRSGFRGI